MFNKKIRLMDIDTSSLVWIEFSETKHIFFICDWIFYFFWYNLLL